MYAKLLQELNPKGVQLVAVSKTQANDRIMALYDQGQRIFGENRVQELKEKYLALPDDIQWHFIGRLQKNKVKHIAPFISMIHSVDSYELAEKISNEAIKNNRIISILLQVKISSESSKQGATDTLITKLALEINELPGIKLCGTMGMASFTTDLLLVRQEFDQLMESYKQIKSQMKDSFITKSMGMSGDYKIAIAAGSNMVRIGSLLFK